MKGCAAVVAAFLTLSLIALALGFGWALGARLAGLL